ncbi:TRAP transporter fused permease subunit [Halobellus sp. GM3]|uniref:TRAP transporter fused permease subunit n=1 Tax=Halobellus sp. GM3 TaxID=3458410 RepID=UPI00403DEBA9
MTQISLTQVVQHVRESGRKPFSSISGLAGVLLSGLIVWYTFYGTAIPRRMQANLVLGACILIYYFHQAYERREGADTLTRRDQVAIAWFAVAGIAGTVAAGYVHLNYYNWLDNSRLLVYNNSDLVVGATVMILVLDITYRSFGRALSGAVILALLYGVVGESLPGMLQHRGLSISELIARETIVLSGVYGSLLQIAATWVAIFILFAGFVEAHGGFNFIRRLGLRVATLSRSGIAQSSVISSMVVGMLTGGAAVNVALTGSFTIPLMKEYNIPPRYAAAIESMASSGGQILPPIMGLAAFLIADFIGIPYADVIVSATIPALLFYGLVAVSVHILVISSGWSPEVDEEDLMKGLTHNRKRFAAEGLQYLLPLIVLMYCLIVLRLPIMLSGGYTIGTFLLLRILYDISPLNPGEPDREMATDLVRDTIEGLRLGAIRLAPFVGLLAALGMIVTVLGYSGLGLRIATSTLIAGGGSFVVILLIAMGVSLLFGLGMPTPAAYILVAAVLAPALIQVGLPDLTAHLFVFYFALLSAITPPVAVAVAVASEIAEADFLQSVKATLVLGGPAFAIPYLFVANPALLTWAFPDVIIEAGLVGIGMLGLVFSLTGSNGATAYSLPQRAVFFVLFPVIGFVPSTVVRVVAAALVVVLGFRGWIAGRLPVFDPSEQ